MLGHGLDDMPPPSKKIVFLSLSSSKPNFLVLNVINLLFHCSRRVGHVILLRVAPQNAQNDPLGSLLYIFSESMLGVTSIVVVAVVVVVLVLIGTGTNAEEKIIIGDCVAGPGPLSFGPPAMQSPFFVDVDHRVCLHQYQYQYQYDYYDYCYCCFCYCCC